MKALSDLQSMPKGSNAGKTTRKSFLTLTAAVGALMLSDMPAAIAQIDVITVESRKRVENAQEIPVVVSAFDAEALEKAGVTRVEDLQDLVPGFQSFSDGDTAPGGGFVSIRGITTGALNIGSSQAVSLIVDGVQISNSNAFRNAQFDLERIEVLKGPQPLFFGKNSTGGIIAVKTADPTDEFFFKVSGAYEFEANEKIGEVVLSGPLSETLGARLAVNITDMDGYLENTAPGPLFDTTIPDFTEFFGRATFLWEPTDNFSARLSGSYADREGNASTTSQQADCNSSDLIGGLVNPGADCIADDRTAIADVGFESFDNVDNAIISLEMSYDPAPWLNVVSVTGFNDFDQMEGGNANAISNPDFLIINDFEIEGRAFSQELRLATDFDSPFNFVFGGLYNEGFNSQLLTVSGLFPFGTQFLRVDDQAYSLFLQGIAEATDALTVTAGFRYSWEKKEFTGEAVTASPLGGDAGPYNVTPDERTFDNISPEVNVTWRPQNDVTLFATYKQGFKSGSFDLSNTNYVGFGGLPAEVLGDISFDEETADGFELGVKSEWFDNTLRFNVAYYNFKYDALQLTEFLPTGGVLSTRVNNSGSLRAQGVEVETIWAPPQFEGLTFNGAMNWNRNRFIERETECQDTALLTYTGPAGECTLDLSGLAPGNAPDWTANMGVTLDRALGMNDIRYRVNVNGIYSSSYDANAFQDPLDFEDGYTLLNVGLSLYDEDDAWALDITARNVTDEFFVIQSSANPLTNVPLDDTFTTFLFPTNERLLQVNRGRELMIRLTVQPNKLLN
ncbi:MAG: TonB-dependent receptor [Pseudomonadota bacterium]